jgi:predicted CopG family antitoxin
MNGHMKTITLDEEAYARLRAWKRGSNDSFSKVVKRVVPEAGRLGALANFAHARPPGSDPRDEVLESTLTERPAEKPDPWT